jgi:hypothetical protein
MSDKEDKKVEAKVEGVDVSGYMPPPDMGPVSPFPPGFGPPAPCPTMPDHDKGKMTLGMKLMMLKGQQVTVYVMGMGPVAPVPVLPAGGAGVVPGSGAMGITGLLHEVGVDYLALHVDMVTTRVVYVPFCALASVVPGGPLEPGIQPNMVTTLPGTTL